MSGNAGRALWIVSSYAVTFGITAIAAFGQITGGLRAAVSDPSGAPVPKAMVTLTSLDTKQARTQSTNDSGEFSFEVLPIILSSYGVAAGRDTPAVSRSRFPLNTNRASALPMPRSAKTRGCCSKTLEFRFCRKNDESVPNSRRLALTKLTKYGGGDGACSGRLWDIRFWGQADLQRAVDASRGFQDRR